MRSLILSTIAAVAMVGAVATGPAWAAGCAEGAAVGGVAGHVAGGHGVAGAAAGCAIGHHEANKNASNEQTAPANTKSTTQ